MSQPLEQEQGEEQNDLSPDDTPKLGFHHYLNALVYFANVGIVCIAQFFPWIGGRTLDVALKKHATILSAKHSTWDSMFLVWLAIFFFEFLFIVGQFSVPLRDHPVVSRISFWWLIQQSLQAAYFIFLMFDSFNLGVIWITAGLFIGSFVMLVLIIGIVENTGKKDCGHFWCLRAPFSMHAGYMLCDSIAWVNVLLQVRSDNADGVVIATSMTGITAILTLTTVFAIAVPRPDALFCFGVAYTYYWVALELLCDTSLPGNTCRQTLKDAFDPLAAAVPTDATLDAFHYAAFALCFISLCLGVLAFGLRLAAGCQKGRVLD